MFWKTRETTKGRARVRVIHVKISIICAILLHFQRHPAFDLPAPANFIFNPTHFHPPILGPILRFHFRRVELLQINGNSKLSKALFSSPDTSIESPRSRHRHRVTITSIEKVLLVINRSARSIFTKTLCIYTPKDVKETMLARHVCTEKPPSTPPPLFTPSSSRPRQALKKRAWRW